METMIKNLISKKLITVDADAPLCEADDLMSIYKIRHLPVVNEDEVLVGIVSKSDFNALKFIDPSLSKLIVKNFMSSPVKAVSPRAKVKEVAKLFIEEKISSVLVVSQTEAIGIVTTEDLLRLLAENNEVFKDNDQIDMAALADEGWISMTVN